jgi:threonine synthase
VRAGALPFCCQGSENGLTIEGGMTLAWELAEAVERRRVTLDRVFVQVGGGALASAVAQGLKMAVSFGVIPRMPRLHAVQTEGGWPLRRAWERLRERIVPGPTCGDACAAERMARADRRPDAEAALTYAREHRAEFMWPWETPPKSAAHGILDDETYDWNAVCAGMVESGGWPVTVTEAQVREAHDLSREATGVPADATGTAGLAGLMALRAQGAVADGEKVAVLLTGVER